MTRHTAWLLCAVALGGCGGTPAEPPVQVAARREPGEVIFEKWCVSCHGAGQGNPGMGGRPGTVAIRVKYKGEIPPVLTDRIDLTADMVTYFVRNGIAAMPPFRRTEISDGDLQALGRYLAHVPEQAPGGDRHR